MIRARAFSLGAAGLALALTGCREVAGPSPLLTDHRAVYSVLEVGSPAVSVLAEELLATGRVPLRGAQAMVSGAAGAAPLIEAAAGQQRCFASEAGSLSSGEQGCYTGVLPEPPGPAETLTLDMTLPDGNEVRGALVTPGPPVASIPPDSQRVSTGFQALPPDGLPIAIVPIALEEAPGASRVDVVAKVVGAYRLFGGGATIDPAGCDLQASTGPYRLPPLQGEHDFNLHQVTCREAGNVVPWDSLDLAVHVISMEENYAAYFDRVLSSSSIDATRASFGIDGAIGVFGAVATTVLPLKIIFDCSIVSGCFGPQ